MIINVLNRIGTENCNLVHFKIRIALDSKKIYEFDRALELKKKIVILI